MLALQREVESGYLRGPAYPEAVGTAIAAHLVIPDTSLFARAFRLSNSDLQKIENDVAENIGGPSC